MPFPPEDKINEIIQFISCSCFSDAAERAEAKEKKAEDQDDSGVESPNPAKETKPELADASTATDRPSSQSVEPEADKETEIKPVPKG